MGLLLKEYWWFFDSDQEPARASWFETRRPFYTYHYQSEASDLISDTWSLNPEWELSVKAQHRVASATERGFTVLFMSVTRQILAYKVGLIVVTTGDIRRLSAKG